MIKIRLVNVEYYMSLPVRGLDVTYSHFRGAPVKQVPVIRIFGITEEGKKICMHIHGLFPYIYIPVTENENIDRLMYQVANSLDEAINNISNTSKRQHIFKISLNSGIPFYGYHQKPHQFLKIYFYNPFSIKKATTLLEDGSVTGKMLQPYEAHIPFILQFFIDYNLHGMSFMTLSKWTQRAEMPPLDAENSRSQSLEFVFKTSFCELEGDAFAEDILNKEEISGGSTANPGLAYIWAEEMARRRSGGKISQSTIQESQERKNIIISDSELRFREQLSNLIQSDEPEQKEELPLDYPLETPPDAGIPEASFRESHQSMKTREYNSSLSILNSQDMSLLEAIEQLLARNNEETGDGQNDGIENDSILGSQVAVVEGTDSEDDVDLTQPLNNSDHVNSESENAADEVRLELPNPNDEIENSPWEESFWSTAPNISQLSEDLRVHSVDEEGSTNEHINPSYVDGNFDDEESQSNLLTPKKNNMAGIKKIKTTPTRRYEPLKISIQKSPVSRKGKSETNGNQIDMLRQLQQNAAQMTVEITSPTSSGSGNLMKSESERIEKVKRNLKPKRPLIKKKQIIRKPNKSLRIKLLKKSNSQDSQGDGTQECSSSNESFCEDFPCDKKVEEKHKEEEYIGNETYLVTNRKGTVRKVLFPISERSSSPPVTVLSSNSSNDSVIENSPDANETFISLSETVSSDCDISSFYGSFHIANKTEIVENKDMRKVYKPCLLPPSKQEVMHNLSSYGLYPLSKVDPFYGNPEDVSTSKEIGSELIKLPSKFTPSLENFEGSFGNILEVIRLNSYNSIFKNEGKKDSKFKNVSSALATKRPVLLTPINNAPTYSSAISWLKSLKSERTKERVPIVEKQRKILIPQSPDCSQSESITLSPCTPQNSQVDIVHSTPGIGELAIPSPSITPIACISQRGYKRNLNTNETQPKTNKLHSIPEVDETGSPCHENSVNSESQGLDSSKIGFKTQLDIKSNSCTIDCVTPENSGIFKMELQNLQQAHARSQHRYLTLLGLEIFVGTRGDLKPDPDHDAIIAIFYTVTNDVPLSDPLPSQETGIVTSCTTRELEEKILDHCVLDDCLIKKTNSEIELINELILLVRKWDPDILAGYEIEMLSWGYIIERGYRLEINLVNELSRIRMASAQIPENLSISKYDLRLPGRIVLNVWKLMRHEVALMSYTFENIMYHVLHTRVPAFSFKTLTGWWSNPAPLYREMILKYYLIRIKGLVQILDQLDFIGRTSELASLFGIQFFEVLSRGSQFRVESMMLRMAKPMNFVPVSPSVQQRAAMRAPACLPLIMEPHSRFYSDPVIVLDFQSLYPSMIIAYNLCFSTCLGRVEHLGTNEKFEFGCTELKIPKKFLKTVQNDVHISPVGIAFVKSNIRKGILPKMLEEILNTRLLVKKSLKEHKNDKILHRVLDARQLGLKLIANVTYGYTSANFSGRMACVEIADSVVSKGRETLEQAISLVDKTDKWGARVIYGDTDSMFVLCPGKTRKEAFIIGQEIADAVTESNPKPVKLKLEKVYQPCILQTKKRYVGYMYESPDQEHPVYNAKGIETVRRDGCPAVSKILEKSLRILFETCDVSKVKKYVCRQLFKLFAGRLSLQELTFAREYRGIHGYKPGACVPALRLAKEWLAKDKRAEPRVSERVGYIIACGPPGVPLIHLVHSPHDFLSNPNLKINAEYYILKAILPPLDRCLSLIGAHVLSWYKDLPKKHINPYRLHIFMGNKKATISQYFKTVNCLICDSLSGSEVCTKCQSNPQILASVLSTKISLLEYKMNQVTKLCTSCCERFYEIDCISLDCPVLYRRKQMVKDGRQAEYLREIQEQLLSNSF